MMTKSMFWWLLATLMSVAQATTLNDGLSHVVDFATDQIIVRNNFFGEATSVTIASGGLVQWLEAHEDSRISIAGGEVQPTLKAWDRSQIGVFAGSLGTVYASNNCVVEVYDGSTGELRLADNSKIVVHEGTVRGSNNYVDGYSTLIINGGTCKGYINCDDNSQVEIAGGIIEDYRGLVLHGSSSARISGGSVWGEWEIHGSSALTVIGNDFQIDGRDVPYGIFAVGERDYIEGTLSGTLANGDPIDQHFIANENGSLVLAPIPEPCTLALLALGGLAVVRRRQPPAVAYHARWR